MVLLEQKTLGNFFQMDLDCMTCMETSGSGPQTFMDVPIQQAGLIRIVTRGTDELFEADIGITLPFCSVLHLEVWRFLLGGFIMGFVWLSRNKFSVILADKRYNEGRIGEI